jgi:hypothetical protein
MKTLFNILVSQPQPQVVIVQDQDPDTIEANCVFM